MKRPRGYETHTFQVRAHESLGVAFLDDLKEALVRYLRTLGGPDVIVSVEERGTRVKVWVETREGFKARTKNEEPRERSPRFGSTGTFVRTYR